ncbi:hypothetical protein [Maritimibacter sp. DP1N21-5]|uniref:hypothetical protein n=1 Tax=Maritimibacter sp. DP1N21-5 TaxID=2836867 RepID=UPI001C44C38C|nr:hypothetical protein [Maritimibacter sp. DP1N21-5]MBV7410698.1 hypothetical protein [Maritimibacter sp. DP1N21-5]
MTQSGIAARNRANAAKSTGPRTLAGKAVVSRNAVRHGATSQPDPEVVAVWLAIILDRPEVSVDDLVPADDRGFRALSLAQAEARLFTAELALLEFEQGRSDLTEPYDAFQKYAHEMLFEIRYMAASRKQIRTTKSMLSDIARVHSWENGVGGRRHRLLKRYVGEARAQRRRALFYWVEDLGTRSRVER